ncbi:MAG: hypothetical protein J5716_06095 [Alphaproteobacteria bacterium]|nr:hypothetical protein [Alphaproteobacteria bacterium]
MRDKSRLYYAAYAEGQDAESFAGQDDPFAEETAPEALSQNAGDFDEEKHKRGADGKFTSGGGKNENFSEKDIENIIDKAKNNPSEYEKVDLGNVSDRLKKDALESGFDLSGYSHNIDVSGVRCAFLEHGNPKTEENRGQKAITDEDIKKIPQIVQDYDYIEFPGKNSIGRDVIKYQKKLEDGTTFYVEEIRTGRKNLTIQTMYKRKS